MAARLNKPRFLEVTRDICGTYKGYQAHYRNDEVYCEPCRMANRERFRTWYKNLGSENEKARYKKNRQNPEYIKQRSQTRRNYRAAKFLAERDSYQEADILHIYGIACHICEETIDLKAPRRAGEVGWERSLHMDHVIPLSKGGTDTIDNVLPSHASCNLRKSARMVIAENKEETQQSTKGQSLQPEPLQQRKLETESCEFPIEGTSKPE